MHVTSAGRLSGVRNGPVSTEQLGAHPAKRSSQRRAACNCSGILNECRKTKIGQTGLALVRDEYIGLKNIRLSKPRAENKLHVTDRFDVAMHHVQRVHILKATDYTTYLCTPNEQRLQSVEAEHTSWRRL